MFPNTIYCLYFPLGIFCICSISFVLLEFLCCSVSDLIISVIVWNFISFVKLCFYSASLVFPVYWSEPSVLTKRSLWSKSITQRNSCSVTSCHACENERWADIDTNIYTSIVSIMSVTECNETVLIIFVFYNT